MEDRIDEIYNNFILGDAYNQRMLDENSLNLEWVEEKLDKGCFLKMEKEISDYVILNDKDMFRNGFKCAWELFKTCEEKEVH